MTQVLKPDRRNFAIRPLQELPNQLHDMARQVTEEGNSEGSGARLSATTSRLLGCASSCAVAAALAYRAETEACSLSSSARNYGLGETFVGCRS